MKLQIEGQKLRVRVDEAELARLLDGHTLQSITAFAGVFSIKVTVEPGQGEGASLAGDASTWRLAIPAVALKHHAAQLPSRNGLHFSLTNQAQATVLELLFDVDVRDSVRRRRKP